MARRGLVLGATALLIPLVGWLLASRLDSPSPRQPAVATSGASQAPIQPGATAGVDPNLPRIQRHTRRLAANAVDASAGARFDRAVLILAERFVGSPSRSDPPGRLPSEHLELDLSQFDALSYVEQVLALANSRRVRTQTEAVDRFSDHLRRLRYGNALVAPCQRLLQPAAWAEAAERKGYLINLSRSLPGASQLRLSPENNAPAAGSRSQGPQQSCPAAGNGVSFAYLPLSAAQRARGSFRNGDLFLLVGSPERHPAAVVGFVERRNGRIGALLSQPRRGVVREPDLFALVRNSHGLGLAVLRPLPNEDGQARP